MKIVRYNHATTQFNGFKEEETLKELYYSMGWNFALANPWQEQNRVSGIREMINNAIQEAKEKGRAVLRTQEASHYIFINPNK